MSRENVKRFFVEKKLMKDNEAEVYTELWVKGDRTISQLSDDLDIHRNTVDNVKKSLLKKGFIDEAPGEGDKKKTPQYFRAENPTVIIESHFMKDVKEICAVIDQMQGDLEVDGERNASKKAENWLFIKHKQKISLATITRKIANAKKSVMLYGTDCDFASQILDTLKGKNGSIDIQVMGTFKGANGKAAKAKLRDAGIKTIITSMEFVPFCIIDDSEVMFGVEKMPSKYYCIFINNEYAVRRFISLFNGLKGGE